MRTIPSGSDFDAWVGELASSQRRRGAKLHLLAAGARAVPAIRGGLHHPSAEVRRTCVSLLDKLLDDAALPDLVAALDDADAEVCRRALHALACDQCKQGACRPADDVWVPRAIELLADPRPDVRAGAIDALGKASERNMDIGDALVGAASNDPDAGLRSMARRVSRR